MRKALFCCQTCLFSKWFGIPGSKSKPFVRHHRRLFHTTTLRNSERSECIWKRTELSTSVTHVSGYRQISIFSSKNEQCYYTYASKCLNNFLFYPHKNTIHCNKVSQILEGEHAGEIDDHCVEHFFFPTKKFWYPLQIYMHPPFLQII